MEVDDNWFLPDSKDDPSEIEIPGIVKAGAPGNLLPDKWVSLSGICIFSS
jgi:hypothetical protein